MKRLLFLASLLLLVPIGLVTRRRFSRGSTATDIVARQYEAIRSRDWDRLAEFYSADVDYKDPEAEIHGRDAVIGHARDLEAPFVDASFYPRFIRGDDSFAVTEWTYQGTPVAPPDGQQENPITVFGLSFFEVRGGQIVDERSYWTMPQKEVSVRGVPGV